MNLNSVRISEIFADTRLWFKSIFFVLFAHYFLRYTGFRPLMITLTWVSKKIAFHPQGVLFSLLREALLSSVRPRELAVLAVWIWSLLTYKKLCEKNWFSSKPKPRTGSLSHGCLYSKSYFSVIPFPTAAIPVSSSWDPPSKTSSQRFLFRFLL